MIIPDKKQWIQPNTTDVLGNIWSSFNIDLSDNVGRLRVGSRLVVNVDDTDDADLGLPVAFGAVAGKKYAIAGSKVFVSSTTNPQGNFVEDTTSGVPTNLSSDYSDMNSFNGYLYMTTNSSNVYKTDGSTYSNFSVGSTTGSPRILVQYGDRNYMTDGNSKIVSWNTSDSVASLGSAYTLDFSSNANERKITFMRASASRIWIGTMNLNGGKGAIYEWDGISTQATRMYRLEASGALSGVIKDDIPYVFDSNGDFLYWNGGNFVKITGLNKENHILLLGSNSTVNPFIHRNGMSVIEGNICALIRGVNGDNASTIEDTIPSGVYEFVKDSGLIHKHSITLTKSSDTSTDFGQIKLSKVGALAELNIQDTASTRNGTFLAGVQAYYNATSTRNIIAYDDSINSLQKSGILITPKIDSANVDEVWQKVYAKVKRFSNTTDKMVVKYRIHDVDSLEFTGTWTSTTTFTTTADLSSFAVGDEITVIQGLGSGKPSHITALSLSTGTYTVTVDETYTGASSSTFKAKIDKWIKSNSLSNKVVSSLECPIGKPANLVQIKVWLNVTGRKQELESLIVVNQTNKQAK